MRITLTRLTLEGPEALADAATAAAWAIGAQGVELKDADTGYPAGRMCVIAWLADDVDPALVRAQVLNMAPGCAVNLEQIPADWQDDLAATPPLRLGRFWVVTSDAELDAPPWSVLRIEPGLAFGAGTHPTTRLCAEAIQSLPVHGDVLDVGAGTGILAMIASRLGASRCTLIEIDTAALASCKRNLARNGIAADCHSTLSALGRSADLVVANLYRDPLLELAAQLIDHTHPQGKLIISGFTDSLMREVLAHFGRLGMQPERTLAHGEWRAVVMAHHV